MNDTNEQQQSAINYAGQMGGEYLDSIKKYDLRYLTQDEWSVFTQVVCNNYHLRLVELAK